MAGTCKAKQRRASHGKAKRNAQNQRTFRNVTRRRAIHDKNHPKEARWNGEVRTVWDFDENGKSPRRVVTKHTPRLRWLAPPTAKQAAVITKKVEKK